MNITLIISSLIISTILHFSIQKLFIFYKKFDAFNDRSSHNTLATRTGGIGVFLTLFFISLLMYFYKIDIYDYSLLIPLGIMIIIGVYDDLYNADFKLKFFLQIIVAKILIDQGFIISNYYGLFGIYEIPRTLAQLSTVFVFIIIVNSINFIDGIDGLALSEVIKAVFLVEFFSKEDTPLKFMGIIIIFSLIPLYYFNFKKDKKIFLGDGGSLLLGTVIAAYLFFLLGNNYNFKETFHINKALFSVIVILYPLIDLLRVFILRISKKRSPFEADQNHLHHIIFKGQNHFKKLLLIESLSFFIFVLIMLIKL